MERGLVHSGPIHRLDLLFDAGGHSRRRKELDAGAPNAKTVGLVNHLLVLAHVELRPAVMLFRHPVMVHIDDEALFHDFSL
ncbi:MAG: hypothetical protein A3C54_02725 [Deltaproteobacteria bacterium RIFCSPHIGHO2_02_FULL_60_17]|nr:MAG: hypothetical protein A3C54_02725 [Deltaproteobacteria bacterium RIFCSPHIGHO2_02_FULL_60_17]